MALDDKLISRTVQQGVSKSRIVRAMTTGQEVLSSGGAVSSKDIHR
jgi:hypothetical protein